MDSADLACNEYCLVDGLPHDYQYACTMSGCTYYRCSRCPAYLEELEDAQL